MMQPTSRKTTVYLDPDLHRSLRKIKLEAGQSISSFVNEAVRLAFEEADSDTHAFETREHESDCSFDDVVADLKRRGKI